MDKTKHSDIDISHTHLFEMLSTLIEYIIVNQLIPHVRNRISLRMSIKLDEMIPDTVEKALSVSSSFNDLEACPSYVLVSSTAGSYSAPTEIEIFIMNNSFRDRSYTLHYLDAFNTKHSFSYLPRG